MAILVNAGFEYGNLNGWTFNDHRYVSAETSHIGGSGTQYTAPYGTYFCKISGGLGQGLYGTLTQSFQNKAGQTLVGHAAFSSGDYMPFNDDGYVRILNSSLAVIATPWWSDVATVGGFGDGPWTEWTWVIPDNNLYYVQYGCANQRDNGFASYALFDMSQLDDVASTGCVNVYGIVNSDVDHLEGLEVAVLSDGEPIYGEIVTGGAITSQGAEVHVGLPYTSEVETLNVEVPQEDGTLQGQPVKISNVTYRVINTRGGYIGPDEDTVYEAFTTENFEKATELNDPVGTDFKLYNSDIRVPLGAGYEKGGRIYYKQTDPLPVTITAIIPEVTIG